MLIITGHVYVGAADLAQFQADIAALVVATRQRVGNLAYAVAMTDAQAGQWLIAERWADQAALSAHLAAADTLQFVSRWQGRMRGDIRKYDALRERGLLDD